MGRTPFGYFALVDNRYENNPRDANRFFADIFDEAVYAEEVGRRVEIVTRCTRCARKT